MRYMKSSWAHHIEEENQNVTNLFIWQRETVAVHSTAVPFLSTTSDLFCRCVDDVCTRWQKFVFLSMKRWFQFNWPFQLLRFVFSFQTTWCSDGNFPFVFFKSHEHICTCIRLFSRVASGVVKWENKTHKLEGSIPGYLKYISQNRAVFKWLSKNQNQSNYSDQSQQEQTARWTNHNS